MNELKVLGLTALIFYYPIVAGTVLSVFTCFHVDMGEADYLRARYGWWVQDMHQKCYEG